MATVGTGTFTYDLREDWAKLPAGDSFGFVGTVATDSAGRLYAFQRKDPPILVFDPEGKFVNSWATGRSSSPMESRSTMTWST